MSFSVFYAVRFSPAPELGEWLNVAVVGEGIKEGKAGIVVTDSMDRIQAAFGDEAVERVKAICLDLTGLVGAMTSAYDRGEATQPIPSAMRDQALSMSFSEQIVVFEGSFEDALASVAKKYLTAFDEDHGVAKQSQGNRRTDHEQDSDIARLAGHLQSTLARFTRDFFPSTAGLSQEGESKDAATIAHSPDVSTVLVIGGAGHLESAVLPRLLESGKTVRLLDPSASGPAVVEILHPNASRGVSIAEVAKRAGVSADSVSRVLDGATERLRVSPKTADKIRDIASSLGLRVDAPIPAKVQPIDVATAMEGVDVVVYIPKGAATGSTKDSGAFAAGKVYAEAAKAAGVKKFIVASAYRVGEEGSAGLEKELHNLGDAEFAITVLRLGELFGHAKGTEWFGDLHEPTAPVQPHRSVNVLTAQAILNGKVSVVDTEPRPFLHVEDAADAVISVMNAPAEVVSGQIYNVGSEDQVRTAGEIVHLIKQQAPQAEFVLSVSESTTSTNKVVVFTKIGEELGFAPNRSLEKGIAQLIGSLRDGTVSSYMSVRSEESQATVPSVSPPESKSTIKWENLTEVSATVETSESSADQSRQKH
jgi:nucleoside-diphosphate-sugar epimerase